MSLDHIWMYCGCLFWTISDRPIGWVHHLWKLICFWVKILCSGWQRALQARFKKECIIEMRPPPWMVCILNIFYWFSSFSHVSPDMNMAVVVTLWVCSVTWHFLTHKEERCWSPARWCRSLSHSAKNKEIMWFCEVHDGDVC